LQENNKKMLKLRASFLFVLLLFLWCAPVPAQDRSHTSSVLLPPEHVPNLSKVKQLLKAYHDCTCTCGCYSTELNQQGRRAMAFLEKRAAARKPGEKLALVLDIDETSLSNYLFYERVDMARVQKPFEEWAQSAQAPAIESTLQLFKNARQLQVTVFFVSGRREALRAPTEQNLENAGYGGWSELILRPMEDKSNSVVGFKSSARRHIADEGYHIILNVGDQLSDLNGEPAAELSVKLPNPFYFIQ
jgi:acid phosphatase